MVARSLCSLGLVIAALAICAAGAQPAAAQQPQRAPRSEFIPTHIVATAADYYRNGPQQMRPPDGMLPAGTRVVLVQDAGSYVQVRTDQGLLVYVSAGALSKVVKRADITPEVKHAAEAINRFGYDLYGRLREDEGNRFFSPASISTALAMTYAGAAGQTRDEMARTLHFGAGGGGLPDERLHQAFGTMTMMLNSSGEVGGYVLSTANRLWGQEVFRFRPAFLELTRERYGAELATLDFAQEAAAREAINAWVADQTQDRIQDLIPMGVLSADTRLVLTNAIYFKGTWAHEFSKAATKEEPFHISRQRKVDVPLMRQTARLHYASHDDVQVLELPYRLREISMVILLPHEIDGLAALERKLTHDNVQRWTAALPMRQVEVHLPRFKTTSQFRLGDTLKALGMPTAFNPGAADFSRMSDEARLMISEVVHKAFVEVNEEGTEAAAATGAVVALAAAVLPEEKVAFRADHPFVFLLRDNRSGAVLFIGRLVEP